MSSLPHVLAHITRTAWAIDPRHGLALQAVLMRRVSGVKLSRKAIDRITRDAKTQRAERLAAADRMSARTGGAVAVVPLIGTMVAREWESADVSGGGLVSMENFVKRFNAAQDDPRVSTIVLDIDSPGGDVSGVQEAADAIFGSTKPVVSVANTLAASGAYWLATQANEVVVTPSGLVGSVGVYTMHQDLSGALEQEGVGVELISAGKYKTEANPFGPLDAEAREHLQGVVETAYGHFTKAIARGRGVSAGAVRSGFGQGRVLDAEAARKAGMVDRVETLGSVVQRLASGGRVKRRAKAADYTATLSADAVVIDARERTNEVLDLIDETFARTMTKGKWQVIPASPEPAPKQGTTLPDDTRARIDAMRRAALI